MKIRRFNENISELSIDDVKDLFLYVGDVSGVKEVCVYERYASGSGQNDWVITDDGDAGDIEVFEVFFSYEKKGIKFYVDYGQDSTGLGQSNMSDVIEIMSEIQKIGGTVKNMGYDITTMMYNYNFYVYIFKFGELY
jgi:hypothetical protein